MRQAFQELSADMLASGYGIRFSASGMSMSPTICDGETIIVEPLKAKAIRRGDILLYDNGERGVIAHRVVRLERTLEGGLRITTHGDASAGPDAPITLPEVLGRVRGVEREGRTQKLSGAWARGRWRLHRLVEQFKTVVVIAVSLTKVAERD